MLAKKRKVALADGIVLYGVGQKSIVKYYVSYVQEKDVYKFQLIGELGTKSAFITKEKHFYEGETLYKHGYRIYSHTAALEKKYVIYLVRHNMHSKLKMIQALIERVNNLSPNKMLAISLLCDNMINEAAKIDKRIRGKIIKEYGNNI